MAGWAKYTERIEVMVTKEMKAFLTAEKNRQGGSLSEHGRRLMEAGIVAIADAQTSQGSAVGD